MAMSPGAGLQRADHRVLLLAGDATAALVAVLIALWIWSLTTGFQFDAAFVVRWSVFLSLAPVWALLTAPSRQWRVGLSLELTWRTLLMAGASVGVAYLAVYFYASRTLLPRLPVLYFLWEAVLLTLAWRLCYLYALSRGVFSRRALVIGDEGTTARLALLLRKHSPDIDVVAVVDPSQSPEITPSLPDGGVSEVYLAHKSPLPPATVQALIRWQEQGIEVVPMAVEYEQSLLRVPIADLPPDWMFASLPEWVRARATSRAFKRAMDVGAAAAGCVALAVLSPFIAFTIKMDSTGPVTFRQRRIGAGGRVFSVIKFRTMVQDAEVDGPRWASKDDPRVTRVGRWLRRSRLDELPQVLNVLRGDMAIVGPRPERPEFAEQLEKQIPFYRTRLLLRPGLTGWAQVNAEYGDSVADAALKLEYDLYYIKHRSVAFDLWIMLRTVGTVLRMGGQ